MLNSPINKTKKNILQTHFVVLFSCVVVFTAGLKSSLNLLIEINKQQTANELGYQLSWFIFYKKAKANNKSVTLRLAPLVFIIMPTKIP